MKKLVKRKDKTAKPTEKKDIDSILAKVFCCFVFILGIFTLATYQTFNQFKNDENNKKSITYTLEVKSLSNSEELSGCKTVYAEKVDDVVNYSFDDGVTWQNSNYATVCENKNITVMGMNEDENIIAEGEIEVNDLDENLPKIYLDYETEVTSLEQAELLKGVVAKNGDDDATKNVVVSYEDLDDKNVLVTYYLEGEDGITTVDRLVTIDDDNDELITANAEVKEAARALELTEDEDQEDDLADIDRAGTPTAAFTSNTYNCLKGETKAARVKIKNPDGKVKFKKYGSDNNAVATVTIHPTRKNECKDTECAILQIKCTGAGTAKINATLSNGNVAKATAKVSSQAKGFVEFNRSEYNCSAVRTTLVGIKVESDKHEVTLKSVKSSDTSVASVSKIRDTYSGDDRYYIYSLDCKKKGSVSLTATTSSGKEAKATVNIKELGADGKPYASPAQITCTKGGGGYINIQAGNKGSNGTFTFDLIKNVVSSDTSIATILRSKSLVTNCAGCNTYEYYCLKSGSTSFVATTNGGTTLKVPVRVYNDANLSKGTVTFDKDYTCTAGKSIAGKVTVVGKNATLKTLKSTKTSVATITKGTTSGGVTTFKIKCLKAGNADVYAESSTGAKSTADIVVNKAASTAGKITIEENYTSLELGKTVSLTAKLTNSEKLKSVTASNPSSCTVKILSQSTNSSTKLNYARVSVKCTSGTSTTLKFTGEKGTTLSKTYKLSGSTTTEDFIKFSPTSVACYEGKTASVVIKSGQGVKSFTSSNTSVMTVSKDSHLSADCDNCQVVKVKCVKKGTATLSATSKTGKTGSLTVKVLATGTAKDGVHFGSSSYTCDMTANKKITIDVTTSNSSITSLKTSNSRVATVKLGNRTKVTNGYKYTATITCRQDGSVNVVAIDNKNKKATAKLTVSGVGTVTIPDTISCKPGNVITFHAKTTTPKNSNKTASITSFESADTKIAEVRASNQVVNCSDCRILEVACKKEGKVNISVKNSLGAVAYSKVTVAGKSDPTKVKFADSSYTCDMSKTKTFKTTVSAGPDVIKSVTSSDSNVAAVSFALSSKSGTSKIYDVTVTCKKNGTTKLTATSEFNAKGTMTVKVTNGGGSTVVPINFVEKSYTCTAGKKITIYAYSMAAANKVTTSDKNIATAELEDLQVNESSKKLYAYANCGGASGYELIKDEKGELVSIGNVTHCISLIRSQVKVNCKKAGSVNVTITNTTGGKGVTKVTVKKATSKTEMSFDKSKYTCEPGKKITTTVELKNPKNSDYIKTIKSSNTAVAKVSKTGNQYGGGNSSSTSVYQKITIECVKAGTVTLTATSNKNVKGTAKVTVEKAATGTVKFSESTYKCVKGKKTSGQVTISNGTLKSITSDNILVGYVSIGNKTKSGNGQVVAFTITCLKTGTTKIHAKDSNGKTATATVKAELPVVDVDPGTEKSMYFATTSVSCTAGKKVYTRVMTTGGETVKSLKSDDEKIAKIIFNNEFTYSDKNAHGVIVKCLSNGTTKVSATSGSGSTATIPVKVGVTKDAMLDNDRPMLDMTSEGLNELVDETVEE